MSFNCYAENETDMCGLLTRIFWRPQKCRPRQQLSSDVRPRMIDNRYPVLPAAAAMSTVYSVLSWTKKR